MALPWFTGLAFITIHGLEVIIIHALGLGVSICAITPGLAGAWDLAIVLGGSILDLGQAASMDMGAVAGGDLQFIAHLMYGTEPVPMGIMEIIFRGTEICMPAITLIIFIVSGMM